MPIETAIQAQEIFGAPTVDPRRHRKKVISVNSSPSVNKKRWDQKVGDFGRDVGSTFLPGSLGALQRGLTSLVQGVDMARENTRWFKENAPDAKRYAGIPMNVRESVMTDRDKDFENKYLELARLAPNATKKQYYLDQADTARRNSQITRRINYGLGKLDLDPTPFRGYESYNPGFTGFKGETGPRFDIDRFSEAMSEYLPQEPGDWGEMPDPFFMEREWEAPYAGVEKVIETDLMPHDIEDITETITEDDFVLKKAQFDLGNLGVGNEYSPSVDLNIMNIKDSELRKKATEAALMFHQAYTEGEGGKYYGQLEEFWQAYMDAVEAGAKPSLEDITSQIEDMNFQFDDALEDQADLLNRIEALKNENRVNNMLFDI